ncbi:hypothetical protein D3C73_1118240 [compost metagenome]
MNTKVNLPFASGWIGVVCQSLRSRSRPRKVGLLPLHSLPSGTTAWWLPLALAWLMPFQS